MEVLINPFVKYRPLIASGFLVTRVIMRASKFSWSCSTEKFLSPILLMMKLSGLILNSMRPCLLC